MLELFMILCLSVPWHCNGAWKSLGIVKWLRWLPVVPALGKNDNSLPAPMQMSPALPKLPCLAVGPLPRCPNHHRPQHAVNTPRIQGWGRPFPPLLCRVLSSISRHWSVLQYFSPKYSAVFLRCNGFALVGLCEYLRAASAGNPGQIFSLF